MANFTCRCGEIIRMGIIPHPGGFQIRSEVGAQNLAAEISKAFASCDSQDKFDDALSKILFGYPPGRAHAYECPSCYTLHVMRHAVEQPLLEYEPIENRTGVTPPSLLGYVADLPLPAERNKQ
jgi:hypothetical protein